MSAPIKTIDRVRPIMLRRLFESCTDSKTLGDICRLIGGQEFEHEKEIEIIARMAVTPSDVMLEFRRKSAARHRAYVARKKAEDPEGWKLLERERARLRREREYEGLV